MRFKYKVATGEYNFKFYFSKDEMIQRLTRIWEGLPTGHEPFKRDVRARYEQELDEAQRFLEDYWRKEGYAGEPAITFSALPGFAIDGEFKGETHIFALVFQRGSKGSSLMFSNCRKFLELYDEVQYDDYGRRPDWTGIQEIS